MRFLFSFLLTLTFSNLGFSQQVSVGSENSETVGLYEKYEITVQIDSVTYSNPYDPDEVDLRAVFTAPSGRVWEIFGFYDNYNSTNIWKVRFSANETGTWNYYLTVKSPAEEIQSVDYSFEATASKYHGWIRVSDTNPHYFVHDDGTSFYGVGPYYPWNVNNSSTTGLGKLESSGCNFWGYWNIMYDTGEIIESVNSGLGRYDQPKCGRIDQLIYWSEDRNLKMMLAIWPHDLLSNTVWAHQWHKNPYKDICTVEEFFESDTAWVYQKKQYRYLIARWGYSRSMGVWEIVNEINGTDGWQAGKEDEARLWVKRVSEYLKENDPFGRPTTASMSGGQYWPEGYAEVDIPNVHVYETGWQAQFPGNHLRSSLWVYYNLAQEFWNDFDKPAIYGEAGYTNSFGNFTAGSDGYLAMFHNALWVSWAGGMSATPVWWSFTSRELMTDAVMGQILSFSKAAKDIDYASEQYEPFSMQVNNSDIFIMQGDNKTFGWGREIYGNPIFGKELLIPFESDTTYQISWINTWTGTEILQEYVTAVDSQLTLTVPHSVGDNADAAFIIRPAEQGTVPAKIKLQGSGRELKINSTDSIKINCLILDTENRFCGQCAIPVQFTFSGPGRLSGNINIITEDGKAAIHFLADSTAGEAWIIAQSVDIHSDTISIQISDKIIIDDFEGYHSKEALEYAWFIKSGTNTVIDLDKINTADGQQALRVNYSIGDGSAPYAGVLKHLDDDYSGAIGLSFWLKADNSNRPLAVLLNEKNGRYWQYDCTLSGNEGLYVRIPLSEFISNDSAAEMDITQLDEISFNVLKGNVDFGSGAITLDDIHFYMSENTTVINNSNGHTARGFKVYPNYPNPFNSSTAICYQLSAVSKVDLSIYNLLGQKVATLISKKQPAGQYKVNWNGTDKFGQNLASGIYVYQVKIEKYQKSNKCVLLK